MLRSLRWEIYVAAFLACAAIATVPGLMRYATDLHPHQDYRGPLWVQVVVARYAEDVSWLRHLPFTDVIVYDKNDLGDTTSGDPPANARVVKLPNVGRCDHTYLHHIVSHYDRMADVTLFLPGSCADFKDKWSKMEWVVGHVSKTGDSAFPVHGHTRRPIHRALHRFRLSSYRASHTANSGVNPESRLQLCPDRPLGKWWVANGLPDEHDIVYQGIFAVSRRHIAQQPKARYAKLLKYVDSHSNPEAGHYLERAWMAVFHPIPRSCRSPLIRDWDDSTWVFRGVLVAVLGVALLVLSKKKSLR